MFNCTTIARIAHWFSGHKHRFRYARERRYHPNFSAALGGRIAGACKIRFRTNRWNYKQGYKDMP